MTGLELESDRNRGWKKLASGLQYTALFLGAGRGRRGGGGCK